MPIPTAELCKIVGWKSPELHGYCCALVRAGLDLLNREVPFFGTDDVPEPDQPESPGVSGCAVRILVNAGVLDRYNGHHPEMGVFHGRRLNRRKASHSREIHLYSVVSRPLAEAFLERHNITPPTQQMELFTL